MSKAAILVADDSPDICQFLAESVLTPAGYRVHIARDGSAALVLAQELIPDLVITDQQMPGLSGLELIDQLKSAAPEIPVILMTAEGSEQLAIEALRAGAFDYLTKPFEAEYMLSAVGRALAEADRQKEVVDTVEQAKFDQVTLEKRVHELETLTSIGRNVTAMLEQDEVLLSVVNAAVRLTDSEEGSLLLLDEESGELYMRASKNFDEEFARTFRLHVQDSLAGQVLESGGPVLLDERTPKKIKTSYLVHSLIYVPLKVRGRTIGVLGVDNRRAGRVLSDQDIPILQAMADYAAIAIENARLYHHTEAERVKLETVLTQVENAVIVLDPDHRLLMINRRAREAFEVNGDWQGKSMVEAFDDPRLLSLIRTSAEFPRREELMISDGRVFNAQRTPIEGVGQAIVMQDITHLKELDRIKSEFVTTVSHDLRSPLTAILGYVELIERAGDLNEQQHEFIHRVHLSVEQITELVNDLLDLGRIEAGLDIAKEKTPISVLARYAVESLRANADTKGLKLEIDLPENIPLVYGAPTRLRQMLGNLIENAIKYTPSSGTVRVEAQAESDQVILRVKDTGSGIPPADQPYLFDKFFRGSNIPEDAAGTGLGLSIVNSIVDNHGGRIWVESKLGEGSVFTVVLPVEAA
jgi:two-component system NtrC family sensor kinase